jgi:hypothetical protein
MPSGSLPFHCRDSSTSGTKKARLPIKGGLRTAGFGAYLYRLLADDLTENRKIMLVK